MRQRRNDLLRISTLALTALAVSAAAVPLAALSDVGPEGASPEARGFRLAAQEMVQESGDLTEAADYLVETARELAPDDPERAENLRLASRYYYAAGRLDVAYTTLVDAATAAFGAGQQVTAAHTLIDAGIVAAEDGEHGAARRAADKAGFVVRVSDFTPRERSKILSRIEYVSG